jgi:hypothetical protein
MTDHYWRCRPENKEEAEKWPAPGRKGMVEQKELELEIPGGNSALADLLVKHCGWKWYGGVKHSVHKDFGWAIKVTNCGHNEGFSKDLNAMKEVERELKRRGLYLEYGWEMKNRVVWSICDSELMFLVATRSAESRMNAAIRVLRANPKGINEKSK